MEVDTEDIVTLGDLDTVLRELKAQGWSRGAILFVAEKVWWEDAEEERRQARALRELLEEA